MTITTFPLILHETKLITPSVRHLAFRTLNGESFSFIPGQFITIHFNYQNQAIKRSYSIATIPNSNDLIEFAASYFPGGPGTEFLFNLTPGDTIEVSGPHGRLILREEHPKRYILIATGTGVTPYRSMLPELAKRMTDHNLKTIVLLGVKNREELLYGKDFIHFSEQYPNFEFRAHYSRMPEQAALMPYEYRGYVQSAFPELNLDPTNDIVYLCGNPKMIDDAFAALKEKGFDSAQVRREKYVSSPAKAL